MESYPKHVFLTGATGFVGKCVLEKIIRSFPEDVIVYTLIRAKGKSSGADRLKTDIFQSQIFDRLRKEKRLDDDRLFFEYMTRRVKAIEGDVSMKGLGIDPAILNDVMRAHVELAIHCAASVDFDERLDLAIGNNITGALETLQICASCPKIKRIVHVSTAYVSVNQRHRKAIQEKIPELTFDYMGLIRQSLSLTNDLRELETFTQKVLSDNGFPNTYTITKAIAEVLINEAFANHPTLQVHIVRPSIVGAAWREPVPGWVDVVSAASAVFLAGALGIVTLLPGDPRGVADLIPVDIVSNHILRAGVDPQVSPVRVSHSCSSMENPVRWRVLHDSVQRSFHVIGFPKARLNIGSRLGLKMVSDPAMFKLEWTFCYDVPTALLQAMSNVTRDPKQVKMAKMLAMLSDRAGKVVELFTPFTRNEFFFSTETSIAVWNDEISKGDLTYQCLNVDVKDVAWTAYFYNYVYGLERFILHEDLIPVTDINLSHNDLKLNTERLITWDADHHLISFPGILPDVTWAYTQSRAPGYTKSGGFLGRALGMTGWREGLNHEAKHVPRKTVRKAGEMQDLVIGSDAVVKAMRAEAKNTAAKLGSSVKQTKRTSGGKDVNVMRQARVAARSRAEHVYRRIASTLEDQPPRAFGWMLRKVWRSLFDGIQVDELGVDRVRSLVEINNSRLGDKAKSRPVVLVPSHRSYVDFLVLSYILFAYNIPVSHIAASEDFLNMGPVSNLLRASGAFFIKRDSVGAEDPIYREVFKEYMFRLLEDGQILEFFVEGTRSRSGKSLMPKNGMLKMLQEAIIKGRVDDVLLVPINISYERPLEVSLYAEELLGSNKPKETLMNLIKGATALGKKFGKIFLQFSDPVSMKGLESLNQPLGLFVVRSIDSASVCFTTHLVATLLLMYRNGATFEQLLRGLAFMRGEVTKRGGRVVGVEGMRPEETLNRALTLLGGLVAKRNVPALYQVDWSPRSWTNFLALSYYRNHIIHLFSNEAIWAAVIHSRSKVVAVAQAPRGALVIGIDGRPSFEGIETSTMKNTYGSRDVFGVQIATVSSPQYTNERPTQSRDPNDDLEIAATQEELIEDVRFLNALLRKEFVSVQFDIDHALADLDRRGVVEIACEGRKSIHVRDSKSFALLCSISWPLIDGYFVASTALFALVNGHSIPLPELSSRMLALAETLYMDGVVMHYESCSSGTLANSLETLHEWGVIQYNKVPLPKMPMQGQRFRTDVKLCPQFDSRDALRSLVGKIDNLRKRGHRNFSVDEAGTAFGVAHFPVLARM